jgi:hypothetical protein
MKIVSLALMLAWSAAAQATPDGGKWTYLQNEGAGRGLCLDIINDGANDRLHMAACGGYTGQHWMLTRGDVPGYVKLHTEFTSERRCLDVVNDGKNDRVQMDACAKVSGQQWKVTTVPGDQRYIQLTNQFTGSSRCLEVAPDGLRLRSCGDFSGQRWRSDEWPMM